MLPPQARAASRLAAPAPPSAPSSSPAWGSSSKLHTTPRGGAEWGKSQAPPQSAASLAPAPQHATPHLLFPEHLPFSFPPTGTWTHLKTLINKLPSRQGLTTAAANPGLLQGLFTTRIILGGKAQQVRKVSASALSMPPLVFTNYMSLIQRRYRHLKHKGMRLLPPTLPSGSWSARLQGPGQEEQHRLLLGCVVCNNKTAKRTTTGLVQQALERACDKFRGSRLRSHCRSQQSDTRKVFVTPC